MFRFDLISILIGVPTTLIALAFHELAHGWVSSKLGDPTPKYQGRLTMNPFAHLDLIGTLLMIFTGFGWAKPVEINPMYYKDKVKGMALVGLAGPLANFILAFLSILFGTFIIFGMQKAGIGSNIIGFVYTFLNVFAIRNLSFMVFNLIPFPPLDGFKVLGVFIKRDLYYRILSYEHYIMYILMFLCLTGAFSRTIGVGVSWFYDIIINLVNTIFGIFM